MTKPLDWETLLRASVAVGFDPVYFEELDRLPPELAEWILKARQLNLEMEAANIPYRISFQPLPNN